MPRIAFWGTPDICLPILESMKSSGHIPELIITNPDRPQGRNHSVLIPSAVKQWALENNISVLQPEKVTPDFIETLSQESWDLFVVVAYGKILPESCTTPPRCGTINVHYSLLPRWRGAPPTEAAILAGDTETGITIQSMRYKLDSGPILYQSTYPLTGNEFIDDLRESLTQEAAQAIPTVIESLLSGTANPQEQDESNVTTCTLIKKEHGHITGTESDEILWRMYRCYHAWPSLFFFDTEGKRIKITSARFENNTFIIEKIIREGENERRITTEESQHLLN